MEDCFPVPSLNVVRGGASASPAGREFEIAYVDAESGARRLALIDAWSVPFEECMPVRGFPSYKGSAIMSAAGGRATGSVVGYESWLERDWLNAARLRSGRGRHCRLLWTTPEGLRAGRLVFSGGVTAPVPVVAGGSVTFQFGGLGSIEVAGA